MADEKIYYEDQTGWRPDDFYALWRYLNRIIQYIGPSASLQAAIADSSTLSERDRRRVERVAGIQAKRSGKRDEELRDLDLGRMSPETRYLLKHMLIHMKRYDLALERFPNLRGLADVGELGHPIHLDETPKNIYPYFVEVGIYL